LPHAYPSNASTTPLLLQCLYHTPTPPTSNVCYHIPYPSNASSPTLPPPTPLPQTATPSNVL
ncbi:PREDICTED: uncharacterized protein LOC106819423, partial [Priapulus caudatus]|uniref:Uncharacterized protein LOC106819423 n=1 Tax=Priapulus caudatus TaxID=37621 RepID=A0ABM1F528_PRICU